MKRRNYDQACSLATALDRVGERWTMLIVRELSLGPLRFTELARQVGGPPTDVLTRRLRSLEADGILRRRELEPPAPATIYELTSLGRELERPMLELGRWGLNFYEAADAAQVDPAMLPSSLRVILKPPAGVKMTIELRSGGLVHALRIADGWIAGSRGAASDPDLVLSGPPPAILAALALTAGSEPAGPDPSGSEPAGPHRLRAALESGSASIEGRDSAVADLQAMVSLPERLRPQSGADVASILEAAAA